MPVRRVAVPATLLLALLAGVLVALAPPHPASAAAPPPVPAPELLLRVNQTLAAGTSVTSSNSQYVLSMQAGGSLALLALRGQSLWNTPTATAGSYAIMQTDGNLVVYTAVGIAVWSSRTQGHPGATARLSAAGNLMVVDGTQVLWQSGTTNDTLSAGHVLYPGQTLWDPSGRYRLAMQTDGNLVLYGPTSAVWSTRTFGHPGSLGWLTADGNLAVFHSPGSLLWTSGTARSGAAGATVTPDGSLTLRTADGALAYQAPATGGTPIVAAALSQRGLPYCYAGGDQNGPTKGRDAGCTRQIGYDCSGLALYSVYRVVHVLLPHYSVTQWTQYAAYGGRRVAANALQPGDLVFFLGDGGSAAAPGHVGIYVGNNKMVDAAGTGVPVAVHTLYRGYVGAVRYWR